MANLFDRPNSSYKWIKYRNREGKIIRESTGYRIGVAPEIRQAEILLAQKNLEERQFAPTSKRRVEAWENWVPDMLHRKSKGRTQERFFSAWRTLKMFFEDYEIHLPRQLTFQHCDRYIEWRLKPDLKRGKYKCVENTAVLEFKLLRWIMKYAVQCGYSPSNPAREVTVKRAPRKLFATLTDQDIQLLLDTINTKEEPARKQFSRCLLLSWYHAVRLNETNVNPLRDVRIYESAGEKRGEITFHQKGGKVRTKPLHPQLIPLFEDLQAKKSKATYPPIHWGNRWTKLFLLSGLKNAKPTACFHSIRKTVQNILRRAGLPEEVVMEYVTHDRRMRDDQSTVHDDYNEITIDEMRSCHIPLQRNWKVT